MKFTPYRLVVIALRLMAAWFLCEPLIKLMQVILWFLRAIFIGPAHGWGEASDMLFRVGVEPLFYPAVFFALVWKFSPVLAPRFVTFKEPAENEQEPKRKPGYAVPKGPQQAGGDNKNWMTT